ncbi:MAG: lysylphosphatidylglycerol synthase domain-containing protein, partial [bacterium]
YDLSKRVFNKKIEIPFVSVRQSLPYAVVLLILWLTWSAGFFFLCRSVYPDINFVAAFIFPVSVSYGLLAIFLPGGIGVREGVMVLLLTSSGMDTAMATTISVLSRIWFITGEVFIFSAAIVARHLTTTKTIEVE